MYKVRLYIVPEDDRIISTKSERYDQYKWRPCEPSDQWNYRSRSHFQSRTNNVAFHENLLAKRAANEVSIIVVINYRLMS